MVVGWLQLAPPSWEVKAMTAVWLALLRGTMTVPSGWTRGAPSKPEARLIVVLAAAHDLPPSLDVLMRIKSFLADRKSTRLNSSHLVISYAVFCLKKKKAKPMTFKGIGRNGTSRSPSIVCLT